MLFKTSNAATASYHYALTYENVFYAYQFYHISLDAMEVGDKPTSLSHRDSYNFTWWWCDGDGDDGTPKTNHITSIVNEKHTNYNENLKRIFIRLSCLCVRLLADYAHKFTGLRLRNVS